MSGPADEKELTEAEKTALHWLAIQCVTPGRVGDAAMDVLKMLRRQGDTIREANTLHEATLRVMEDMKNELLEARAALKERDDDVVARLRKAVHEAEKPDVRQLDFLSNDDIAQAMLDNMPWMPTATHAVIHSAAHRLQEVK